MNGSQSMHYFAYGSNLDRRDLDRWCARRGHPALALEPAGIAYLPDRALAFTHRSTARNGGVLDVPEAKGRAVRGVVFLCDDDETLEALDRKESEGHVYRRIETVAIAPEGGESRVFTYEVEPRCREPFVPPDAGYLDVVRSGYAAFGLDLAPLEAAAADRPYVGPVSGLFVYGTLRRGESRHPLLVRHRARLAFEGRTAGTLVDLGPYPTLRPERGAGRVVGELYEADDLEALIADADRVEGFLGFGVERSLYRRTIVPVDAGGRNVLAWTYLMAGDASGGRIIAGGDWVQREHVP